MRLLALLLIVAAGPANAALYYSGSTAARCVALTFDDGPAPRLTPAILDLLARENIPATFFLVGQRVAEAPHLVGRIVSEGHEVGNHTWSHANLARASADDVAAQIEATDRAILESAGVLPAVLRPPYGAVSRGIDDAAAGRPVVLWGIASLDWLHDNAAWGAARVLRSARPGLIILLHDNQTIALDEAALIIEGMRARGYGFSTVSDLLAGRPCLTLATEGLH